MPSQKPHPEGGPYGQAVVAISKVRQVLSKYTGATSLPDAAEITDQGLSTTPEIHNLAIALRSISDNLSAKD